MKIAIIGVGYVGLVGGAMFAKVGNNVVCVDKDENKINLLKKGEVPIYEPGLNQIIAEARVENSINFTNDISEIKDCKVIFLAVGTPSSDNGEFNLEYLKVAAEDVAKAIAGSNELKIIVNKSTVPPGTSVILKEILEKYVAKDKFVIVSNPEFLKEGKAVDDFEFPDRIIIGSESEEANIVLEELYTPFSLKKQKLIFMTPVEAELTKLFANTFLANRVALINEFARICSHFGADVMNIRNGICSDKRIGWEFMYPSVGYGGSCFPKDIKGLSHIIRKNNINSGIVASIDDSNKIHKSHLAIEIKNYLKDKGELKDKVVAVWGLTFKPKTDDMRDSAAIDILNFLLENGAKVKVNDPKGMENAKKIFGDKIEYSEHKYDALKGADFLVLLTEWSVYRSPDFEEIKNSLKIPVIFDGRNIFDPEKLNQMGFDYIGIGRKYLK
jgi:UDPglucose 6-dehydrogenase